MKKFNQSSMDSITAIMDNFKEQTSILDKHETTYDLHLDNISPDPDQPRRHFDPEVIAGIAESIKAYGLIQPIIVRNDPHNHNHFLIVSGEQRYRAHRLLKRTHITCLIRDNYQDDDLRFVQYLENERRSNLTFYEQAEFVIAQHAQGMTAAEFERRTGMSTHRQSCCLSWASAPEYLKDARDHFRSIRAFYEIAKAAEAYPQAVRDFIAALPTSPDDPGYLIRDRAAADFRRSLSAPAKAPTTEPAVAAASAATPSAAADQGAPTTDSGMPEAESSISAESANSGSPQEVPVPEITTAEQKGTPAPLAEPDHTAEQGDTGEQDKTEDRDIEAGQGASLDPAAPANTTEKGSQQEQREGQGTEDFHSTTENPEPSEFAPYKPSDCATSTADPTPDPELPARAEKTLTARTTYTSLFDLPLLIVSDGQQDYTYLPHLQAQAEDKLCALSQEELIVELSAAGLTIKALDRSRTLASLNPQDSAA